jgi:xanthine dehydrogenase YagR molybdenum-binding subunit
MIGKATSRVDGPLKVTGRATYAYEYQFRERPLYGVIVTATVGCGRIKAIHISLAEKSPGVRAVITRENTPPQAPHNDPDPRPPYWRARRALNRSDICHYGESVALVVASTLEEAQAAATLVQIEYAVEAGNFDLEVELERAYSPKHLIFDLPTDSAIGDFDAGFNSAATKIDEHYRTSYCFSQPMEPNACLAVPSEDNLVLYVSTQIVDAARTSIAATLNIDPQKIQIVSSFVGGGFGSKLNVHSETILAAVAARRLQRPVKVALTRRQIFHDVGVRPTSKQRVRLGAGQDGQLVAIAHQVTMHTNWTRASRVCRATITRLTMKFAGGIEHEHACRQNGVRPESKGP